MTRTKSTRRALLASLLALVVSISMLVGTTFAWFTDSVTSGRNIIQTGNLDAKLSFSTWDETTNTWGDYQEVTGDTIVFGKDAKYEPGYTEVVKFKVENLGSLAFQYQLGMHVYKETPSTNVYGDEFYLSDYIKVGSADYVPGITDRASAAEYATKDISEATNLAVVTTELPWGDTIVSPCILFPAGTVMYDTPQDVAEWVFVIHMPTTVGNEANHKSDVEAPSIEFAVNLLATQYTYESDSYDDQYDAGAEHPDAPKDPALNPDDGSTPVNGDTYVDGFYTYTYNTDEGGWSLGTVSDTTQESYAPILESINGEPVVLLYRTFLFCSNMTEAPAIPNGVQKLDMTFRSCSALTVAPEIPDSVTAIVNGFQYCTSLTTAPEIPDSVTSLNGAFNGCTALTTAPVIPANVTRLYDTFSGCTALTGTITINTNKIDNNTGYFDGTCRQCFKGVDMSNITLTGDATKDILNLIGATGNNWTPIQ